MKGIVVTRGTSGVPEFAGSTWVRLQYILGLRRLGVDVFWIDCLGTIDPFEEKRTLDSLMSRFRKTTEKIGLDGRYAVVYNEGEKYFGANDKELLKFSRDADFVINISGTQLILTNRLDLSEISRKAYIDVDPGFTQIWALTEDYGYDKFDHLFTIGQNINAPSFVVPTPYNWKSIRPPIVLEEWPVAFSEQAGSFTTIADWRARQCAVFGGELYENKRPEFLKIIDLPQRSKQSFELALLIEGGDYEDMETFTKNHWHLLNPVRYAGTLDDYRDFIRFSRGEFSVAKHGYVKLNSGWISDRTACYLASGKPALVQSTGFEHTIPTGQGLVTFRTIEEAIEGIEDINANYSAHCHAARKLAEDYFDSDKVLGDLLNQMGL